MIQRLLPLLLLLLCAFQGPPPTPATYRVVRLSETAFPVVPPYHTLRRFQQSALIVQIPPGVPVPACVHFESANGVSVHVPVQTINTLGNGRYAIGTEARYASSPSGVVRITAEHHAVDLDLLGQVAKMP